MKWIVAGLACPLAHPLAPSIKFKEFELTGCWLWAGGQPASKQSSHSSLTLLLFSSFNWFHWVALVGLMNERRRKRWVWLISLATQGKWKRKKGGRLGPKPITNYPAIWNSLNFNGGSRRKQPFFPFTSQKQKINLLFLIVKLKIYYKSKLIWWISFQMNESN